MTHHRRGLRRLTRDDALVDAVTEDYESAGLDAPRLAMLRYADKLTRTPGDMVRADVEEMSLILASRIHFSTRSFFE